MTTIVLVVYDPADKLGCRTGLGECLESIKLLEGDYELIVVNNCSGNPSTRAFLAKELSGLRHSKLLDLNENKGTSGGFNAGAALANKKSKALVYMSPDAQVVQPNLLNQCLKGLHSHTNVGIVHPFSVFEDNKEYNLNKKLSVEAFRTAYGAEQQSDLQPPELIGLFRQIRSNSLLSRALHAFPLTFAVIKREPFTRIGGFDEGFRFGCYENIDLALRLRRAGYTVHRLNTAVINHRRSQLRGLTDVDRSMKDEAPHARIIEISRAYWQRKYGQPLQRVLLSESHGQFVGMMLYYIYRLRSALRSI